MLFPTVPIIHNVSAVALSLFSFQVDITLLTDGGQSVILYIVSVCIYVVPPYTVYISNDCVPVGKLYGSYNRHTCAPSVDKEACIIVYTCVLHDFVLCVYIYVPVMHFVYIARSLELVHY